MEKTKEIIKDLNELEKLNDEGSLDYIHCNFCNETFKRYVKSKRLIKLMKQKLQEKNERITKGFDF